MSCQWNLPFMLELIYSKTVDLKRNKAKKIPIKVNQIRHYLHL